MKQKDRLELRDQVLNDWESRMGLTQNNAPGTEQELNEYLSYTRDDIEKMGIDKCLSVSYRLSLFAFYFQRCVNRTKSSKTWAENELKDIVSQHYNQYDKFTKYEVIIGLVCRENSAAKELNSIINTLNQRLNRLDDIASGIRNISYVISLITKSRFGDK